MRRGALIPRHACGQRARSTRSCDPLSGTPARASLDAVPRPTTLACRTSRAAAATPRPPTGALVLLALLTTTALRSGSPGADPAGVLAAAGRVHSRSQAVRALAGRVAAGGALRWQSAAATSYRAELEAVSRRLLHGAAELDRAASLIEDHAHTVQHRLALLETDLRGGLHLAAGVLDRVAGLGRVLP